MSFGRCVRSQKQDFETDLRGWMQVCQKVEVVGNLGHLFKLVGFLPNFFLQGI